MKTQCSFITGDQRFLLLPAPSLQLLLALDGLPDIMEPLDKDKLDRPSPMRIAPSVQTFLMLGEAAIDIIRDTHVVLAVRAAKDVDEVVVVHMVKVTLADMMRFALRQAQGAQRDSSKDRRGISRWPGACRRGNRNR